MRVWNKSSSGLFHLYFKSLPPQIIQQQKINTYIEIPEIFIIILQNRR